MQPLIYLQHYPTELQQRVRLLQTRNQLGAYIAQRYPDGHQIQTDRLLYDYCNALKQAHLRNAPLLDKVAYDNQLTVTHHALGINRAISRVQGVQLKAKKEIRIAGLFKQAPEAFLRMIVVHELAHIKEVQHNKAFYKLCVYMEPNYHQLELDCRLYLTWKNT